MIVRVKLYGMLQHLVPNYNVDRGLFIEIPELTTYGGLIKHLGIPESSGAFAIENSRVMKNNAIISGKKEIRVMQPVLGG